MSVGRARRAVDPKDQIKCRLVVGSAVPAPPRTRREVSLGNRSSQADHYSALDAVACVVRSIEIERYLEQSFPGNLTLNLTMRNYGRALWISAEPPSDDRVPRLVISGCLAPIRDLSRRALLLK
jgi:hypothetical protein